MPNFTLSGSTRRPFGTIAGRRQTLRQMINWLESIISGEVAAGPLIFSRNDAVALGDQAFGGQAVGALVLAAGAGAVGATIDGTAVTAVFAVSDSNTMTLVAAAIKAAAAVNRKVTCTQWVAGLSFAAVVAGTTVDVFGIRFTAVAGAPSTFGEFDVSGADAADAASFALAVNRHPALNGRCRAVANGATIYIGMVEDRAPHSDEVIGLPSAATITVLAAAPVLGTVLMLFAMVPGDIGNCVTVVPAGVGMTYATANAGKLGAGQGGGSSLSIVVH